MILTTSSAATLVQPPLITLHVIVNSLQNPQLIIAVSYLISLVPALTYQHPIYCLPTHSLFLI